MTTPTQVTLEDLPCPLGCARGDKDLFTGGDLINGLPGSFTVVKCCTCGLMRTNPRPTANTIGFYYPDNYGPYIQSRIQSNQAKTAGIIKSFLRPIASKIFNFNMITLPIMKPGRMLEIGCASGLFLHHMANQGWQVQGIEFSENVAQAAAKLGFDVYAGALETAPTPDKPYDLIVGWMVVEHLHDPVGCLKKLREWAKPGATLAISVPNSGSLEFLAFKNKSYALQLPTHLYHFTPKTIEKVLDAGGWSLEKVLHQRTLNNLIGSLGFLVSGWGFTKLGSMLIDFPERPSRWTYFLYPLAFFLSLFGQTGRMTIWAKVK